MPDFEIQYGVPYIKRGGKNVPADKVFEASHSGDLSRMLSAVSLSTYPTDRHFLLQTIVGMTYKLRKDPEMRAKCIEVGELHLSEFPNIAPALVEDMGVMPRVTTFQHLATVFTENGEYDRAIDICWEAVRLGLRDGTKGGFEGRIARIEKKQGG